MSKFHKIRINFIMNTYRNFCAFTVALAFTFIVAYVTGLAIDESAPFYISISTILPHLPTPNTFTAIWISVYILIVALITISLNHKCLRHVLPKWGMIGAFNVLWGFGVFKFSLTLFGLIVLILAVITLIGITLFYIKNTRYAWVLVLPILLSYIFALVINVLIILDC
ncbi:MAG: tryptophan-rich sensory protein [Clostridia bacterium]|nr:tryptophan-rich sensory protein [Clostridia bacterium]